MIPTLMFRIDFVSKHLLANCFRNCRKRKKLRKSYVRKSLTNIAKIAKITNPTRINTQKKKRNQEGPRNVRKYRKSNKGFSCLLKTPLTNIANIAKITNLKRIKTWKQKKPRKAPKCQQISHNRKSNKDFFAS